MSVTIDGSAGVTTNTGAVYNSIQSPTAQASTSGTSIDFTGIPSWVKRITVAMNGVSTNGSALLLAQIGSGTVQTSGYSSYCAYAGPTNTAGSTSASAGFAITAGSGGAGNVQFGNIILVLVGSNTWVASYTFGVFSSGNYMMGGGGSVTLTGTLDRVRITTTNGTDTFDAGSINILYE